MKIKDCYEDFLCECTLKRRSEETVESYRKRLKGFEKFCREEFGITDIKDVTPITIKTFSLGFIKRGRKARTANTYLIAVRLFLRYCFEEGYIEKDISKSFDLQKEEKPIVVAFNPKQVKKLMSECKKSKHNSPRDRYINARNAAILSILFDCGIRANELCKIENCDVHLDDDFILIRHAKTKRQRVVPITAPIRKTLVKYIKQRDEYFSDGRFSLDENLFLSYLGKGMRTANIEDIFRKLGKDDIFKSVRCSPHTARHTFACQMLTSHNMSVYEIQRLLGHSSLQNTATYLSSLDERGLIQKTKDKSVLMNMR